MTDSPALSLVKSTDEEIQDFASFLLVEDWNQECHATGDLDQESDNREMSENQKFYTQA